MKILRIPTGYNQQIKFCNKEDCEYILKTIFELANNPSHKIENSMRGGLVSSIYREAVQMENRARAKKGEKYLNECVATDSATDSATDGICESQKLATKSRKIKEDQERSNQIKSIKKITESDRKLMDYFLGIYPKKLQLSKLSFFENEFLRLSEEEKEKFEDFIYGEDPDFGGVESIEFMKSPQNWIADKDWMYEKKYKVEWNDKFIHGTKDEIKKQIGERWFPKLDPIQFILLP